jgi:hypothetical protein
MKNEILEFFLKNNQEMENIIEDCRFLTLNKKINDQRSVVLLNILYEFIKEEKTDNLSESLKEVLDESILILLVNFLKEEKLNIIDFFINMKRENDESYPRLVDFDWKFVGLGSLGKFEIGEITPKILMKLIFNNGNEKIIETDYSNFKKLHEEIEENLSSFNSTYAKRIETFSK